MDPRSLPLRAQIAQALVVHDSRPDVGISGQIHNSVLQPGTCMALNDSDKWNDGQERASTTALVIINHHQSQVLPEDPQESSATHTTGLDKIEMNLDCLESAEHAWVKCSVYSYDVDEDVLDLTAIGLNKPRWSRFGAPCIGS